MNSQNSHDIRSHANKYYNLVKDFKNFDFITIRGIIQKAIGIYEDALKIAETQDEKYKTIKNIYLAYVLLIEKLISIGDEDIEEFVIYSELAIKNSDSALKIFPIELLVQNKDAQNKLFEGIFLIMIKIIKRIEELKVTDELNYFLELEKSLSKSNILLSFLFIIKISSKYLSLAIKEYNLNKLGKITESKCTDYLNETTKFNNKAQESLNLFISSNAEFYNLLKEKQSSEISTIQKNISETNSSVELYQKRLNGLILLEKGKVLYEKSIAKNVLDDSLVNDSLDCFREVISIRKNINVDTLELDEIQRIVLGLYYLGLIYFSTINDGSKAKEYLNEAILTASKPKFRSLTLQDWYRDALHILSILKRKEDDERKKDIPGILKNLEPVLSEIFKKYNSLHHEDFLIYLSKNHKPSDDYNYNAEEELKKSSKINGVLKMMMGDYHPDKFKDDDYNDVVLKTKMNEITKLLSQIKSKIS